MPMDIKKFLYRDETLLSAVLFGFLVLLSLQVTTPGGEMLFKHIVYRGVAPILRFGDFLYRSTGRVAHDYLAFRRVVSENEELRERLREMEVGRLEREFLLRAQGWLAELADYRSSLSLKTETARVIARDLRNPYAMLVINRGQTHGVEVDMTVLAPEGVVGRVVMVSRETAQVQLLTDAQSAAAVTHLPSGEQVLVVGQGASLLKGLYLSSNALVAEGDWMVASGMEGIYFPGLRVGKVEKVATEEGRRVAWVSPSAPLTKLTLVLVVKEHPAR